MNAFWIGFSTQKINGRLVGGTLSDGTTANTRLAGWLRKVVARNELTMRTRSMQLHRLLSARSRACAASQIDDNRLAFGSLWKDAKEWHKYDAFGAVRILAPNGTERATSLYKNRFLFTGREYAATFGFYEYRARAYNPTLGRFMSEDPKGFDAGDYNLFRYCHNDPLDRTDPMGLFDWVFSDDYPEKGPGGREAFTRGMQTLGSKAKGAEILAREPNRTFVIKPTTGNQVTQWRRGTNDMYFNPKDPLFLDPKSRRDFSTNPKELPPTNDKGRAAIQAHEFGHATTRGDKGRDDIYPGGRNVRLNENPVRREQGIPERETYAGRPLGGKIPGTAIDRAIDTGQAPIQPQMDAAQIDNQQGDVPDFGMLGGGPLGLGGPPRSPSR